LCGPVSRNPVDFEVSYGAKDRWLQVCRYCREDLELLGLRVNQIIQLPRRDLIPRLSLIEVLGPVYGLIVAGWKVSGAASLSHDAFGLGNGRRRTCKKRDGENRAPLHHTGDSVTLLLRDNISQGSGSSEGKEQSAGAASPIHESATTMMEAVA
jgi:hypothetical protein